VGVPPSHGFSPPPLVRKRHAINIHRARSYWGSGTSESFGVRRSAFDVLRSSRERGQQSVTFHFPANPLCFSKPVNPNFPPKLASHLAESVGSARRRYRKRLARCQEKFSEKAVHDLRIDTRRILALLDLIEALHFGKSLNKLRKTFKKRLDAFDDLRDTHVQRVLLKPMWAKFPEAKEFKKHLRKCEKRIECEMSRNIKSAKSGGLNRCLKDIEKALCQCASDAPIGGSANQSQILLSAAFRRVVILRRQIRRSKPATIHRMRIAFKRFRYTAELLQPFLPDITDKRLQRMKDFQDAAGNIQDVAVLLERIDQDIEREEIKAASVKNLRRELSRCEQRAIDALMERIHELMDFEPKDSMPSASELQT
jgi:CHAD domain-containing protein